MKFILIFICFYLLTIGLVTGVTVTDENSLRAALLNSNSVVIVDSPLITLSAGLEVHSVVNLEIRSTSRTVLDCQGAHMRGLSIFQSDSVKVAGIDFRGCRWGGILFKGCKNSTLMDSEIEDCAPTEIWPSMNAYSPVSVFVSTNMSLTRLHVHDNVNSQRTCAEFSGCTNLSLTNSLFERNQMGLGALQLLASEDLSVTDVIIQDSDSVTSAMLVASTSATLRRLAMRRMQTTANLIASITDSRLTIIGSKFSDFTLESDNGPAFFASQSNLTMACTTFSNLTCTSPACSLMLFEGDKRPRTTIPSGFSGCEQGVIYQNGLPTSFICRREYLSTLTLEATEFIASGEITLLSMVGYTQLEADNIELSTPGVAMQLVQGAEAQLTGELDQVLGTIVCDVESTLSATSNACGSAGPCACNIEALGNPSLATFSCPAHYCDAVFCPVVGTGGPVVVVGPGGNPIVVVNPGNNGTIIVSPGTAPTVPGVISPVIEVNGTGLPAEITIVVNGTVNGHVCLAYYDTKDEKWKCVDECVTLNKTGNVTYVTGVTPHFTNFAILLGGGGCNGNNFQLATWVSIVVAAGVSALFILIVLYVPFFRALFFGDEAIRVEKLRHHTKQMMKSDTENTPNQENDWGEEQV